MERLYVYVYLLAHPKSTHQQNFDHSLDNRMNQNQIDYRIQVGNTIDLQVLDI